MSVPFAYGPADGPPDLRVTAGLPPQVCVRLRAGGLRLIPVESPGSFLILDSLFLILNYSLLGVQLHNELFLHGQVDLLARGHRDDAAADGVRVERQPVGNAAPLDLLHRVLD